MFFRLKFNCARTRLRLCFILTLPNRKSLNLFTLPSYFYSLWLRLRLTFFCTLIFDTSWFYVKRTLSLSSAGFLIKKEVRVAFGAISDTTWREIGFNVYFFSRFSKKKYRVSHPVLRHSRGWRRTNFSPQLFSMPSKFYCIDHWRGCKISPRGPVFFPVSFFFNRRRTLCATKIWYCTMADERAYPPLSVNVPGCLLKSSLF